ncbi:MAG: amidohydrolase/deacetylase family metallohydrolase [Dehalococcoidia bacterium]
MSIYDIVISGGRVLDPGRGVDALRDVAIVGGRIAKVADRIDPAEAARNVDARGKLVTPGLIDVHAHIYHLGIDNGLDPDLAGVRSGVTTIVDAGSAGSASYDGFHHHVIAKASTRVLTNLHIARTGLAFMPEARDASDIDLDATIATVERYKGEIIGVKVRACGPAVSAMGIEYVKRALTAARESGVRVMVHIGDPVKWSDAEANAHITADLIPLLEPGDMLTHLYTGAPGKVLDGSNRVLPELLEARERGVAFDPAHGRFNFSFEVAKRMLDQGVEPLSISTDITAPGRNGPVKSMTHIMSKFLALGFPLHEVIRMSTYNPAGLIGSREDLGTLGEGTTADIAILEEVSGDWTFDDASGSILMGAKALRPILTFKEGTQFSVDYGPFPWGWLPNPAV